MSVPTWLLAQVTFNGTDFTVAGAAHMAITGTPTTTLWFDAGYGMRVYSCENVTVSMATIDYWVLPYVQATVVTVLQGVDRATAWRGQWCW
jgi:hypothetical protein